MPISGLCQCGCGQPTNVARWNNRNSPTKAGEHYRFLPGHGSSVPRVPNVIRDCGSHAEVVIRSSSGDAIAIVDLGDVPTIERVTWWLKNGYAHHKSRAVSFYMHHLLLGRVGISDGLVIDHINRNQLDNRRDNLRVVPRSLNCHNSVLVSQTGLRGAYYNKRLNRYAAKVNHDGREIRLGWYDTAEEAHAVSIAYLREHALIPKCWSPD